MKEKDLISVDDFITVYLILFAIYSTVLLDTFISHDCTAH